MSKYKIWLIETNLAEEKNVFHDFDKTIENVDPDVDIERINL